MATARRIAATNDVPAETTLVFTLREIDSGEKREGILVRTDDDLHAWFNYCQHYTHIKIDKGTGAEMRNGELICENHGAYFESDTGFCNFGPCEGAYLNEVEIEVEDGDVYLVDDDYEFVREGPIEADDADLESKSNYKF
ncbi:Rieske (2Fe-2S) protein [Natronomonas salsuginis]|jgi:nitrite reductase/ring-hydroxylating ferredoxin subunit|uniref:(2Fe-2S)-binding protein n=1 Tax=Natronomonas salsuginis TaxID=2217661 RepID=A0A4U5J747_9EURY|nr:Rieske 2Fe-2S domain-containing protein [Natronomonas salsuginis]TKR24860.1 (2Fe-2S)-binding protein [Natronomonas salsuginis]